MGFLFFGKKKNKEKKAVEKVEDAKVQKEKTVEPKIEKKAPTPRKKEEKTVNTNTTKKDAPVVEEKPKRAPSSKKVYHISLRKEDGKWQVKYGGGKKALKLFDTQAEAIKFAEEKADSQDGSISIHKKDGKIRKQDYSKKSEDNK